MMFLGAEAAIALRVGPTPGGILVSLGLLAHAVWDVYHHRAGRVVSQSLAEFCAVLDVVLGVGLLVLIVVA